MSGYFNQHLLRQVQLQSGCDQVQEVPGFPGYAATANGQVWSCWRPGSNRNMDRQARIDDVPHQMLTKRTGYLSIRDDGRQVTISVARVLALTFLGPPPDEELSEATLRDYDKPTTAGNVVWSTRSEIMRRNWKQRHQGKGQ